MIEVPIIDRAFTGGLSMQGIIPRRMKWLWKWDAPQHFVVFTDRAIEAAEGNLCPQAAGANKIALLIEARHFDHTGFLTLNRLHHEFKWVLTHELEVMEIFRGKSLWYPHGGCWIPAYDRHLKHNKSGIVSIVASDKASTDGHKLRHAVIDKFRDMPLGDGQDRLKVYGRKYNPIQFKTPALAPYMFSIAIENGQADDYFTEKLLDCFATGTVPIYWGTKGIAKHFDMSGVIQFETLDELGDILPKLTSDLYLSMRPAIVDNFYRATEFFTPEDWICDHYPFLFV